MLNTVDMSMPANKRADFYFRKDTDQSYWGAIPVFIGFVTAPLYDHRSALTQTIIILSILAVCWPWIHYVQRWIDSRIGFVPARTSSSGLTSEPLRHRFIHDALLWLAIFVFAGALAFLGRHASVYKPSGWIEQTCGIWLVGALFICLRRATAPTNPRQRRLWNVVAFCILGIGWGFENSTPYSHAALLVLLGSVHIALALLDLRLILQRVSN
jgi:hypothetical protein